MDALTDFGSASQHFRAADVHGKPPIILTISAVGRKELRDGGIKPEISFEEDARTLLLNATNRYRLADKLGRDMTGWIGKTISLSTHTVRDPSGRPVPGITVDTVNTVAAKTVSDGVAVNDEIPEPDEWAKGDPLDDILPSVKPAATSTVRHFK